MDTQSIYEKLVTHSKELGLLGSLQFLLFWDHEVSMPAQGALYRAQQNKYLSSLYHEKQLDKSFIKNLGKLIDIETGSFLVKGLSTKQKVCLKSWFQDYQLAKKVPKKILEQFAEQKPKAIHAWLEAKKKNSLDPFAPELEKLIDLTRNLTESLGYKSHPYDALLSYTGFGLCSNSAGITKAKLDLFFSTLQKELLPVIKKVSSAKQPESLHLSFSLSRQEKLKELLSTFMGFSKESFHVNTSTHPFCLSPGPQDQRFTVRFLKSDPFEFSILAFLHEGGHALYNAQLNPQDYGTPLAQPISMAVHESQSRLIETAVGLSEPFSHWLLPHLKALYPSTFKGWGPKRLLAYLQRTEINPIRVCSSELFYNLHIAMRYEMEIAFLTGSLKVKELPEMWNALSQKYLLTTPKNLKEGCLQDIHWALGAFGYFPSYSLGNAIMASLWEAYTKEQPSWEKEIQKGHIETLKAWLGKEVHSLGRSVDTEGLVKKVCKSSLSAAPLVSLLKKRYLPKD